MAQWEPDRNVDRPRNRRGGCLWATAIVCLLGAVLLALALGLPQARAMGVDPARVVYLTVLLAFVVATAGGMLSENPGRAIRHLVIWIGAGGLLALAYSYRAELGFGPAPLATDVAATPPATGAAPAVAHPGDRSVTLFAQSGHFFADAEVEGKTMTFMVDTGASVVALGRDDARKLGISPADRDFTQIINTANGTTRGAPVTLDSLAIGPIDIRNVDAVVVDAQMPGPLLGMSFLNRLSGYQATGDRLVLRQ